MTQVYKLPKDRLYVTYFEGDAKAGLAPDTEARSLWLAQGVAEDHILPGNAKDNFWGTLSLLGVRRLSNSKRFCRNGCYWALRALQVGTLPFIL